MQQFMVNQGFLDETNRIDILQKTEKSFDMARFKQFN